MKNEDHSKRNRIRRITVTAVCAALSIVFIYTLRFPLFTQFYELEFSDFPLLLCAFIVGPVYSVISLFIVCLIQALTVSASSGIIGFVMHFVSSCAMILTVYFISSRKQTLLSRVVGSAFGCIVMTVIMIPMNIWLTSVFMNLPLNEFITGFLGVCIAFNLIKSAVNNVIFNLAYPVISSQYNKNSVRK